MRFSGKVVLAFQSAAVLVLVLLSNTVSVNAQVGQEPVNAQFFGALTNPSCSICPAMLPTVGNPDTVIPEGTAGLIPADQTCAETETLAQQGFYSSSNCILLRAAGVSLICRCELVVTVSPAPTTLPPVTPAPTTEAPVTAAPTTEPPVTPAPTTEAPVTAAPTTGPPVTPAPTEAPVVTPATEPPVTPAPTEPKVGETVNGFVTMLLRSVAETMDANTEAIFLATCAEFYTVSFSEDVDNINCTLDSQMLGSGRQLTLRSLQDLRALNAVVSVSGTKIDPNFDETTFDARLAINLRADADQYVETLQGADPYFADVVSLEVGEGIDTLPPVVAPVPTAAPTPEPTTAPTTAKVITRSPVTSPRTFTPDQIQTTSSPVATNDDDDDGLSIGAIIGIVVAIVVVLAALGGGFYYVKMKKKSGMADPVGHAIVSDLDNAPTTTVGKVNGAEAKPWRNPVAASIATSVVASQEARSVVRSNSQGSADPGGEILNSTSVIAGSTGSVMTGDGYTAGGGTDTASYAYSLDAGNVSHVPGGAAASKMTGDSPDNNSMSGDEMSSHAMSSLRQNMVSRTVVAPPGKLGIVIDTTLEGPVVHKINPQSPLEGTLFPGDIIVAIDDVDTRAMSASAITALMVRTANLRRKLTVLSEDVTN